MFKVEHSMKDFHSVEEINDNYCHSQSEVLAWFDAAIAKVEAEQAPALTLAA